MPVHQFRLRQTSESQHVPVISGKTVIPGAKRIVGITMTAYSGDAEVDPSKISHSIDSATKEITVTVMSPESTSRSVEQVSYTYQSSTISGNSRVCRYNGGKTRVVGANDACPYRITLPEYTYNFDWDVSVEYEVNESPSIVVNTPENVVLSGQDTYLLDVTVTEPDTLDEVRLSYRIDDALYGDFERFQSESSPVNLKWEFAYDGNILRDTVSGLYMDMPRDSSYTMTVWAEDDYGGRSNEVTRTITTEINLPPDVELDSTPPTTGLYGDETVVVTGDTLDPEDDPLTLTYRVGSGQPVTLPDAVSGAFSIPLALASLPTRDTELSVTAQDRANVSAPAKAILRKTQAIHRLKTGDLTYRVNAPTKRMTTVILRVQREVGDLAVTASISMTVTGADEQFVPMTLSETVPISATVVEDVFVYDAPEDAEQVVMRVHLSRENADSIAKVVRVSGNIN